MTDATSAEIVKVIRSEIRRLEARLGDAQCARGCKLTEDDIVFFHRFKRSVDNVSKAVGLAILLGGLGAVGYVLKLGLEAWRIAVGGSK